MSKKDTYFLLSDDAYNKDEEGGVWIRNKIDLSENNFILVFNSKPFGNFIVKELNKLQKFCVLKPCCPKNGPTGGNKFASCAGI